MKNYENDMLILDVKVDEKQVELVRIMTKVKGGFKRYYNEVLMPMCNEKDIKVIKLTDAQTTNRDVWGEDYGFSGRFHSGTRYVFVGHENNAENTVIEIILRDMESDMLENDYIEKWINRYNLEGTSEEWIEEAKKYYDSWR